MPVLNKDRARSEAKKETLQFIKQFSGNVASGDRALLFKIYSSAMKEVYASDIETIIDCSALAQDLFVKIAPNDREQFLSLLESAIWQIDAHQMGKLPNISNLAYSILKCPSLELITELISAEIKTSKQKNQSKTK